MMKHIRKYLIAGILFWVPVWITFLLLRFLIRLMDNSLQLIPKSYRPDTLLHFHIPGLGLIFTLLLLFFTGMIITNFLGAKLVKIWDKFIDRIPLVRTIYSAIKKTLETMFKSEGQAFRKVLLVEYPRKNMWSVAFQTGYGSKQINQETGADMVTVFIPTTPNPTSGFIMMVPKEDVKELDMTIDQGLKFIISLGVMLPHQRKPKESE